MYFAGRTSPGLRTDPVDSSIIPSVIPTKRSVRYSESETIPSNSDIVTISEGIAVPVIRSHVSSMGRFTSIRIPAVGAEVIS